jgi:hypothetical protein
VAAHRRTWKAAQSFVGPDKLVFLDETGVNTKTARLYGWAPVGERCRNSAPFGHWKTTTFLAGLRLCGLTAPCRETSFEACPELVPSRSAAAVKLPVSITATNILSVSSLSNGVSLLRPALTMAGSRTGRQAALGRRRRAEPVA